MATSIHFPAETRKKVLEYLYDADQTAWQTCNRFRAIRLVNRAWCTSANELLFSYILLRAERNLESEIRRVTEFNEMTKTRLSDHVKVLEVFTSPEYYRFYEGCPPIRGIDRHKFSPTTDVLDCLTWYLPECIPRLRNLQALEFSIPNSRDYRNAPSSWNLPYLGRLGYYVAIRRALSTAPLSKLRSLSLEVAELRDLAILSATSSTDNEEKEPPNHLVDNFARIRDLFITVKMNQKNPKMDGIWRYDANGFDRQDERMRISYSLAWESIQDLFATGFKSLEHLEFTSGFYCRGLPSIDEQTLKRGNVTNLRYLSLRGFDVETKIVSRILDSYHTSLEEVHFTLPGAKYVVGKNALRAFLNGIREKLVSMPKLKKATVCGLGEGKQVTFLNPMMRHDD